MSKFKNTVGGLCARLGLCVGMAAHGSIFRSACFFLFVMFGRPGAPEKFDWDNNFDMISHASRSARSGGVQPHRIILFLEKILSKAQGLNSNL